MTGYYSGASQAYHYQSNGQSSPALVLSLGTPSGSTGILIGALTTPSLRIVNSGTLSTAGNMMTASILTNFGTIVASNSTILIDQSFINSGGIFNQMTSTVQFGLSNDVASCNLTNFYNLICNFAGKPISLTNSTIIVGGTFSSIGSSASNVVWTGNSTLVLSNKAYLYFTSPYITFSIKDVEIWDASGGTNHTGTGDYYPH